jgi:hypothetical protein
MDYGVGAVPCACPAEGDHKGTPLHHAIPLKNKKIASPGRRSDFFLIQRRYARRVAYQHNEQFRNTRLEEKQLLSTRPGVPVAFSRASLGRGGLPCTFPRPNLTRSYYQTADISNKKFIRTDEFNPAAPPAHQSPTAPLPARHRALRHRRAGPAPYRTAVSTASSHRSNNTSPHPSFECPQ